MKTNLKFLITDLSQRYYLVLNGFEADRQVLCAPSTNIEVYILLRINGDDIKLC